MGALKFATDLCDRKSSVSSDALDHVLITPSFHYTRTRKICRNRAVQVFESTIFVVMSDVKEQISLGDHEQVCDLQTNLPVVQKLTDRRLSVS